MNLWGSLLVKLRFFTSETVRFLIRETYLNVYFCFIFYSALLIMHFKTNFLA